MAFTPLHDRVLVRRNEGDEKTSGGLIIPDSAKEKPAEGTVVSCGEGARKDSGELIPMACLLYTSPSPRDRTRSRMPSSA